MDAGAVNHNSLWGYVHVTDAWRCSESQQPGAYVRVTDACTQVQ